MKLSIAVLYTVVVTTFANSHELFENEGEKKGMEEEECSLGLDLGRGKELRSEPTIVRTDFITMINHRKQSIYFILVFVAVTLPFISPSLLAPQIDTCNFNFVLPGGLPCGIAADFEVSLTSPNLVFDSHFIVNCTGTEQQRIGICGGISVDCNGFSVTNIGSAQTVLLFRGESVKNCDLRDFSYALVVPQGNISSVSSTKISGAGRGLQITGSTPATVALKDVEVTNSTVGIDVVTPNIETVFDNVFSCGNSLFDVAHVTGSLVSKWDVTCNIYGGDLVGFKCPGCPDVCPSFSAM
jgi:hypothetical protein